MGEKETYYLPVYGYRTFPNASTALSDLFHTVSNNEKIRIYEDEKEARKEAESLLCDDDACSVVKVVFWGTTIYLVHSCPTDNPIWVETIHFNFANFKEKYCKVIKKGK